MMSAATAQAGDDWERMAVRLLVPGEAPGEFRKLLREECWLAWLGNSELCCASEVSSELF